MIPLLLTLAIWIVAPALTLRTLRRRRARIVLSYIEQAVRLNLPLATMIRHAGDSEGCLVRTRLHDLAKMLASGLSLGESMERMLPEATAPEVAAIALAEQRGRLGIVLPRLIKPRRTLSDDRSAMGNLYRFYLMVLFPVLLSTLGLYMIFVVPKFVTIFKDFHVALPLTTRLLMRLCNNAGLSLLLSLVALWPASALVGLCMEIFRIPHRSGMLRRLKGRIAYWTPILRGVVIDRDMRDLCQYVADAVSLGEPLELAAQDAMQIQANPVMAGKARTWWERMRQGVSASDAARQAELPRLMSGMLASVRGDDDLAAVMGFLARHYDNHFKRSTAIARSLLLPVAVLMLGGLVMWFAAAMFLPMAKLAYELAPFQGGSL